MQLILSFLTIDLSKHTKLTKSDAKNWFRSLYFEQHSMIVTVFI
jgi:hypothetical protein